MMDQYTKLADELDAVNDVCGSRSIREAARILRSAAGVDVAGLMAMSDTSIVLACDYLMTRKESAKQKAVEHRAALESALRMALASKEGADGWIEIGQGNLPPLGEQVLVWCKYGPHWGPMVDCWDEQHEAPVSFSSATIPIGPGWDSGSDFYDVTHWMPIGSPVAASQSVAAQEQKP